MTRLITITLSLAFATGCGQREQASVADPSSAVVVVVDPSESVKDSTANPQAAQPPATPTPAPQPPKRPETPSVFEYPPDLAGNVVVKAVAPAAPTLAPNERFGATPKPRTPPSKILSPEPTEKASYSPPPLLTAKSTGISITPPREHVPVDLGRGADIVPAKPSLPIAAAITERARDVNIPPAMPTLGRPLNDRVSLDDPTSEFANAAIVATPVNVPLGSAAFVKTTLPDPFELGEQVKPKVPPAAEPGLAPVQVNPERVK